jgi:glycosyltransferase involved in cell wall biosynthesis
LISNPPIARPHSSPHRVGFLQASLPVGGAERLVQSLMAGLPEQGIEPLAVNLYGPGPVGEQIAASGGALVHGLAGGRLDPGVGGRLEALWRDRGVQVVYVADSALPLAWAGVGRRRRPRPGLVVGFHSTGKTSSHLQHWVAGGLAFPVADRFVALAPSHRDWLARTFRLDPARFDVIPSGVDVDRFQPALDRAAARAAAGLPADGPLVGIVAALRPEKHHDLLLDAAALLAPRVPQARWLIVGDGPERARIEAAIAARGLGERVRMLGARHDTPAIFRALDLAVLCSRPVVETLPVTLIESLASGTPAVSTDVGSVRDVLRDGVTGTLVPAGEAAALAGAVEALLADPERRAAMAAAARSDALARFRRETMLAAYAELFRRVARG